jgi:hypothetical protein
MAALQSSNEPAPRTHKTSVYPLTNKLGEGDRAKSSIKSDGGLKSGGHDRDRTCDPYHVKVVQSTNSRVKSKRKGR